MRLVRVFSTMVLIMILLSSSYADDYALWELPEGAKFRLGKGKITNYRGRTNFRFSPDSSQFVVFSSIGIWRYDVQTGEELSLATKYLDETDEFVVLKQIDHI